ncbi:MAG: 5-formyltetrahydrofolate cyclo-ligase [Mailhella sp.]|nr:5-formyltetrahydrofolate cyclo-ligase [Mailhella sp.]
MDDKVSLRQHLRLQRSALSSGKGGAFRSLRIQERLLESSFWRDCRRVAAYVSIKGEAGTELILQEALRTGRDLFLPRCRAQGEEGWPGAMDFLFCSGLEGLVPSGFGIPEPLLSSDLRLLAPEELRMPDTLVIVPALAFDRKGFRLGYGGGYYDRLLAHAACPVVGLVFHELLVEEIPREPWDMPVQAVCTEEVLLCI